MLHAAASRYCNRETRSRSGRSCFFRRRCTHEVFSINLQCSRDLLQPAEGHVPLALQEGEEVRSAHAREIGKTSQRHLLARSDLPDVVGHAGVEPRSFDRIWNPGSRNPAYRTRWTVCDILLVDSRKRVLGY